MENKDFSNIGEQVKNAVEDALNSKNYQELNKKINRTVEQAIDEAKRQFTGNGQGVPHVKSPEDIEKAGRKEESVKKAPKEKEKVQPDKRQEGVRLRTQAKGRYFALPMAVIGITGGLFTGISTITGVVLSVMSGSIWDMISTLTLFLVTAVFAGISYVGVHGWNRYKKYKRYLEILNGREYCSIKELAEKSNKSEKRVCKDLKELISVGMYMDGYVDPNKTCLTMTDNAYRLFAQAERSRVERENLEKTKKEEEKEKTPVDLMIAKGKEYIEAVRLANDAIPGIVISQKLDRLENVMRKIFEAVREHPEQMNEMDKFMEYYLPTTLKLVNAYKEFDAMEIKGENVKSSMIEIENTIDTINHAFEQLLDDLFQDQVFDISSDISVLHTMLAREGYKEKDFK